MPHAQFEALEAHCQAWREQGIDSNKWTVEGDNDDDGTEEAEDPQGDPAFVETRIRLDTVNIFKRVLLFSQEAAVALYNDQMITTLDVLQDLTDDIIKELCCAIRKPGGDVPGHQISKVFMTSLKLFAFWARHM